MPLPPAPPSVVSGIGSDYLIGNCVANLPVKFGGRQDLSSLADGSRGVLAVMEAIKELTETYEFEELKYQTPFPPAVTLSLTAGNPVVPVGLLLGTIPGNTVYPQFQNQNFVDITDIYTFWMWFAGGVNQAGRTLKYRRIPTIDTYSYGITSNLAGQLGVAPPVYFSRFGNNLQVGPVPDQNYQYFIRVKLRHPFPIGGTNSFVPATFAATINGSGVVTGVTVLTGGQGYLPSLATIPLTFSASPTGLQATGTATSNSTGIITGVTLGSGAGGYASAPTCNTAAVASQQVFASDSWQEIIELCACQRVALWEGASEYIQMFEAMLKAKGFDVSAARTRKAQMQRDELHNERSMSLMTNPYTWA
jgi:hypothetical protein